MQNKNNSLRVISRVTKDAFSFLSDKRVDAQAFLKLNFYFSVSVMFGGCVCVFFIFRYLRIALRVRRLGNFQQQRMLQSVPIQLQRHRVCDFFISGSFRSFRMSSGLFHFINSQTLTRILLLGVRWLHLDVYPSDLTVDAFPVVFNGAGKGSWQLSLNRLSLTNVLEKVGSAFHSSRIQNWKDPLFLHLTIHSPHNRIFMEKIAVLLYEKLKPYLLAGSFRYHRRNIATTFVEEIMGKVIIVVDGPHMNTPLDELVNISVPLDSYIQIHSSNTLQTKGLLEYNRNNITVITPSQDDLNPLNFWKFGCQVCLINYFKHSQNFYKNFDFFANDAFILKSAALRVPVEK